MVLGKAATWYERILRPLRRLTSTTTNALVESPQPQQRCLQREPTTLGRDDGRSHQNDGFYGSQCQVAREAVKTFDKLSTSYRVHGTLKAAEKPRMHEVGSDCTQQSEMHFTHYQKYLRDKRESSSSQYKQHKWRDLPQNPLDILLNDSHIPGHPSNTLSHTIKRPFSTSAADQARKQPPKNNKVMKSPRVGGTTDRTNTRKSSRSNAKGKTSVGVGSSGRQRNKPTGSKKYRSYIPEKIIRRGTRKYKMMTSVEDETPFRSPGKKINQENKNDTQSPTLNFPRCSLQASSQDSVLLKQSSNISQKIEESEVQLTDEISHISETNLNSLTAEMASYVEQQCGLNIAKEYPTNTLTTGMLSVISDGGDTSLVNTHVGADGKATHVAKDTRVKAKEVVQR